MQKSGHGDGELLINCKSVVGAGGGGPIKIKTSKTSNEKEKTQTHPIRQGKGDLRAEMKLLG